MKVVKTVLEMKEISRDALQKGKRISFVPTMGFFHEGHLELIRCGRKLGDILVVSLFVNPTQFGAGEDFDRYPRNEGRDHSLCTECGVDILFQPEVSEMYISDHSAIVMEKDLSMFLCGRSRPGHFQGVATIVTKLFNIVRPSVAILGQKDVQQALIIKRIVRDLAMDVDIVIADTVRDTDGLALSSRNEYLSSEERHDALCLNEALGLARILISSGERNSESIRKKMISVIKQKKTAKIDYVEIADVDTLKSVKRIKGDVLVALAVWIGKTRLIDNTKIYVSDK